MSTDTNGSWGYPFIGDVWSSKKQKMVADANYYRESSNEFTWAIANPLAADPCEQGGSMTQAPFDVYQNEYTWPIANSLAAEPCEQGGSMSQAPIDVYQNEYSWAIANSLVAEPCEQGGSMTQAPIDVDASDDDVLITTPMAFAQARNNSRRNREKNVVNVIDVESEGIALEGIAAEALMNMVAPSFPVKRKRIPPGQTIIDCDLYECLGGPGLMIEENVQVAQPPQLLPPPPPPPPPPKEPTFSCPICMSSFEEPMTTKCGHIFCKGCLKAAIAAQKKCPTCRTRIATMRSTFRVYLPTTR